MEYESLIADIWGMILVHKQRIGLFLPSLIGAVLVFLAGLVLARLIRYLSRHAISNLSRLIPSRRFQVSLERAEATRPVSQVIGNVLHWIVVLFFLTVATEMLGLPVVTTWLSGIATYLPRVLAASLVILAGLASGVMLRDLVASAATSARIGYGPLLGKAVQVVVLIATVLIGVDQLGLDVTVLTIIIGTTVGAILLGAALTFALGARDAVSDILASHYLQKFFRVGQTIRIGEIEGRIVEISATAVILDAAEGRVRIPAKAFSEASATLLTGRD